MKIEELGLEEMTVSEEKETKGGLAPLVYVALVAAGVALSTGIANAPGYPTIGGGKFHP